MRRAFGFFLFAMLVSLSSPGFGGDFDPSAYAPATQADLVKEPAAHVGKKYRVTDPFQFCGSDFCVQIRKTKINTREYYCFTLGPMCLVRMYIRKEHPDAPKVVKLKKGDKVTVYGAFDYMGSNYNYLVVDRVVTE